MSFKRLCLSVVGIALAAVAVTPWAASGQTSTAAEDGTKIVTLQISLDGTPVVDASAIEGRMLTTHIRNRGDYGFQPTVLDDGRVLVDVFEITRAVPGEVERKIQTIAVNADAPIALTADPGIAVQLVDIRDRPGSTSPSSVSFASFSSTMPQPFREEFLDNCCVTCGNVTSCGCAVSDSCGCCETEECPKDDCPGDPELVAVNAVKKMPNAACKSRFEDQFVRTTVAVRSDDVITIAHVGSEK